MNVEKNALRKLFKEKAVLLENKNELSERIALRLSGLCEYRNCSSVFAYFPLSWEVSTIPIIERAIKDGKRVALPRCNEKGNEMRFYYFSGFDELENGRFKGIFEPKKTLEEAVADESTLCLVPALAFGENGSRLGKGMGFYDRFLSSFKGKTAGLCFESCLAVSLPETELDRRVQLIITENKTLFIK